MATHDETRGSTFVTLGIIASNAPRDALLATIQTSCPQSLIRIVLLEISNEPLPHFRVELKHDDEKHDVESNEPSLHGSIDIWLHIKGALMSAFPADKPNAVATIDL